MNDIIATLPSPDIKAEGPVPESALLALLAMAADIVVPEEIENLAALVAALEQDFAAEKSSDGESDTILDAVASAVARFSTITLNAKPGDWLVEDLTATAVTYSKSVLFALEHDVEKSDSLIDFKFSSVGLAHKVQGSISEIEFRDYDASPSFAASSHKLHFSTFQLSRDFSDEAPLISSERPVNIITPIQTVGPVLTPPDNGVPSTPVVTPPPSVTPAPPVVIAPVEDVKDPVKSGHILWSHRITVTEKDDIYFNSKKGAIVSFFKSIDEYSEKQGLDILELILKEGPTKALLLGYKDEDNQLHVEKILFSKNLSDEGLKLYGDDILYGQSGLDKFLGKPWSSLLNDDDDKKSEYQFSLEEKHKINIDDLLSDFTKNSDVRLEKFLHQADKGDDTIVSVDAQGHISAFSYEHFEKLTDLDHEKF